MIGNSKINDRLSKMYLSGRGKNDNIKCEMFLIKATNEVITRVPESTPEEMQAAVNSCKEAYKTWQDTTILTRQQIMFEFQALIKKNLVGFS